MAGRSGSMRRVTPWPAALLVFAVGFVLYANTLGHGFVWDDHNLIEENPAVKTLDWTTIQSTFLQDFWGSVRSGAGAYYRPVVSLSYNIDHAVWGGSARGFHVTNVLLNALAGVLAFAFIYLLFRDTLIALVTALLFAAHPVHTEAVAWISGRTDVMATVWMLASLSLYALWRRRRAPLHLILSLVAFLLAMLSKEIALCLPLLIAILEIGPFGDLLAGPKQNERSRAPLVVLAFFATLVVYLLLRWSAIGAVGSSYNAFAPGAVGRIALPLSIFAGYVWKALWPVRLSGEYDAPIPASFGDPPVMLGAVAAALIVWAVWRYRRRPHVVLGAGIFVLGLAPVMNLVPIAEVSAERFLYFPSLGVALILGAVFASAVQTRFFSAGKPAFKGAGWMVAVLVVLLPAAAARTITRNGDWRSDEALFAKTVAQEPDNPRAHAAIADAALRRGDIEAAVRGYRRSIELNPNYTIALSSLAGIYARQGRYDDALPLIEHALRVSPDDARLISNLGSLYYQTQQLDKAATQFEKALQLNPDELNTHFNLGLVRLQQGDAAAARPHFERAVTGGSAYHMANFYLAFIDNATGRKEVAKQWARAFLAGYATDDQYRRQAQAIAAGTD